MPRNSLQILLGCLHTGGINFILAFQYITSLGHNEFTVYIQFTEQMAPTVVKQKYTWPYISQAPTSVHHIECSAIKTQSIF